MANKIKQSIAAQRQIPDHIKENYPVFVEFIKLYYDFLEQTQAQQLESIRDIDTTLDEFIDKFKAELSNNFPVELTGDKRLVLKHLREFYLSRGSENSYKFLFRVLFNKEADLFYPATQMLRVSDGKWNQDVSIFVQPDDSTADLTVEIGKFITITNARGKVIRTFVNNVIKYNDTIYEVFIQRDYINEIEAGSFVKHVTDTGVVYTGVVLPCPSKVSVYKGGKGFSIGDIFALKTQIGRGCVVKVTKVGSYGSIEDVQVIRFGLDYKSKFWSYLSSKELAGTEYVHPARLNHPYDPSDPAYNEKSGGFIDYGWASKQTYFYYDDTIPVGSADFASDRFFANPDYVGEVVQQFYADDTINPIDEDLAIIQIDLGAVARYPGYYLTADGFVSDTMYIQDGKYYQAFSYVVKVEEELRRYADIVKALIHPAGMKLYAEYTIFNDVNVSATIPRLFSALQLPLSGHPPSQGIPGDRGYSYDEYTQSIVNGVIVTTPADGANKVYSRQGKASLYIDKILSDVFTTNSAPSKFVDKIVADSINSIADAQSKQVLKNVEDVISEYIETQYKEFYKNNSEIITTPEDRSAFFETLKTDIQLVIDSNTKLFSKNIDEYLDEQTDENIKTIFKNLVETISNEEASSNNLIKTISDAISNSDTYFNTVEKLISDSVDSVSAETFYIARLKTFDEFVEQLDLLANSTSRPIFDAFTLSEGISSFTERTVSDFISIVDGLDQSIAKLNKGFDDYLDSSLFAESVIVAKAKLFDELVVLLDAYSLYAVKEILETVSAQDQLSNNIQKIQLDEISLLDIFSISRVTLLEEIIENISDSFSSNPIKNISDTQGLEDLNTSENSKTIAETINNITKGRIRLAPYDGEGYFAVYEDYQPATSIT